MKLSDVIKQYRSEHGLSQRQMGAQCGLSTGYISLIEKEVNPQTGKQMVPSLPVLNKISAGMGLTLDNLLAVCDDMDVTLSEQDSILPVTGGDPQKPTPTGQQASGGVEVTPLEAELLAAYRRLSPAQRQALLALLGIESQP